tara:strand:- start:79 stop:441 length:363 start_codon:yes stop_codon:yes gene_type:complete
MMALVFGAINTLIPVPDKPAARDTTNKFEYKFTVENINTPAIAQPMPKTAGPLVPTLSDMRPLIGPNTAIQTEPGRRYNAAWAVDIPKLDTKKNGIRKKVAELATKDKNLAKAPAEKSKD